MIRHTETKLLKLAGDIGYISFELWVICKSISSKMENGIRVINSRGDLHKTTSQN